MSLLIFLFFGLLIGLVARALTPGQRNMGLILTSVLGAVGSLVGGLLGNMLLGDALARAHPAGVLGSVLGAMIVLAVTGLGRRHYA